jgi:capsular polysaccharide biosynthesis protein
MTPHESDRLPAVIDMGRVHYAPPLHAASYSVQEDEVEEGRLPLSQYLWIVKRYRWRILAFCALSVFVTLAVSLRLTPVYEATATIDVDRATPADVVGQDSTRSAFTDAEQFLATQMKLVESDSVIRPVDQRFELRKLEQQSAAEVSERGDAAPVKLKQLKVTRPPNTYLIQISYRNSDPQLAADAANAIAQSYLEHTYNIRIRSSANLSTFMEGQLQELKAKMEQSGKALAAFERDLNVVNPEEKTNILSARLLQLNTDYTRRGSHLDEHTDIQIEDVRATSSFSDVNAITPLEGQKAWEHQAEDNILSRLEQGGLLAPPGPVDEVLNGVVENLIFGAKLRVHAQCRILLTTPFESFSIGNTIVISRGLLDVLPDETSLAMVLADELAHIELGHRTPTQFAFYNQTMLSDAELLAKVRLVRTERELEEASRKTVDILRASPYQQTGSAGLFLKAVASRGAILPRLLAPNLGNQLANTKALNRLSGLIDAAPALEESKIEQIAALPLGSRVKLNPWNNEVTLIPPKPLKLLSAREKMPFEIAPYFEYLRLTPQSEPHH